MKTIEVSDEMYEKLIEMSNEMNNQSHRGTAMPCFFQIQTKEQVSVPEGCGTHAWHYDGTTIESDEEIIDAIFEFKDEQVSKEEIKDYPDYKKSELMEEAGWRSVYYDFNEVYQNAFFTEKACKEHIRLNSYHYHEPVDYLSYATRNPELELIQKFILGLTGNSLHK